MLLANTATRSMAISATIHCLTGCAIGEIIGQIGGASFGWHNATTSIVSIILAFVFGYTLSLLPLLRAGMVFGSAFSIIVRSDTLSILTMEVVDTIIMLVIPGAMGAGLVNPLFWLTLPLSLSIAFLVAVPVNYYLLQKGQGHALVHEHMHHDHEHEHHHHGEHA